MFKQTVWGQCRIKTLLLGTVQDKDSSLSCTKFDSVDQVWQEYFLGKKKPKPWHHLLGETVGNSCSTGPRSKQCTPSDGIERVKLPGQNLLAGDKCNDEIHVNYIDLCVPLCAKAILNALAWWMRERVNKIPGMLALWNKDYAVSSNKDNSVLSRVFESRARGGERGGEGHTCAGRALVLFLVFSNAILSCQWDRWPTQPACQ